MCPRKQTTEWKMMIMVSFFSGEDASSTDTSYCIHILWKLHVCCSVFIGHPVYEYKIFIFQIGINVLVCFFSLSSFRKRVTYCSNRKLSLVGLLHSSSRIFSKKNNVLIIVIYFQILIGFTQGHLNIQWPSLVFISGDGQDNRNAMFYKVFCLVNKAIV